MPDHAGRDSALWHASLVGGLNSHHIVECVLAWWVEAAVEPTRLLPCSPGDIWSPEPPISSWVQGCLLLPQLHPHGLSFWTLHRHFENKLHHCLLSSYICTRIMSMWGRLRPMHRNENGFHRTANLVSVQSIQSYTQPSEHMVATINRKVVHRSRLSKPLQA